MIDDIEFWIDRLELGQKIIKAIADYDEDFYEYATKHAQYPCNDEDKYHDGTANYDDDVDKAEIQSIIDLLQYSITKSKEVKA